MTELTPTDQRLLAALKRDARASVTELAKALSVSRATIQTSLERLLETGTILRFTVDIGTGAVPDIVNAITTIELQGNLFNQVISALRNIPQVISVHTTNGAWDLVIKIEAANLAEFDRILRLVRDIPGVLNSESSILLNKA